MGTPKAAKGRRSVGFDRATVAALRAHLEERLLMGVGFTDHDLVFSKVTEEPRNPERFSREFDRRVER